MNKIQVNETTLVETPKTDKEYCELNALIAEGKKVLVVKSIAPLKSKRLIKGMIDSSNILLPYALAYHGIDKALVDSYLDSHMKLMLALETIPSNYTMMEKPEGEFPDYRIDRISATVGNIHFWPKDF